MVLAGLVWKATDGETKGVLATSLTWAGASAPWDFSGGFFGPMIFTPDANQGPLLGLLITGPLGCVVGAVGGLIVGLWRRLESAGGLQGLATDRPPRRRRLRPRPRRRDPGAIIVGPGHQRIDNRVERPEPLADVSVDDPAADRGQRAEALVDDLGERRVAERLRQRGHHEKAFELARKLRIRRAIKPGVEVRGGSS